MTSDVMTREEWIKLAQEYRDTLGEPMPTQPTLDFGHIVVTDEDLVRYAREAIARRRPIDWREIFGPPIHERYGVDERGIPRALS